MFLRTSIILWFALCTDLAHCQQESELESYDEEIDESGVKHSQDSPEFITTNETIYANPGQDLSLGCQVNKLDPNDQLIWSVKYDHDEGGNPPAILRVGNVWIVKNPNDEKYELKNIDHGFGEILTIKNFSEADLGKYICTIAVTPVKEVHFNVRLASEKTDDTVGRTDAATSGFRPQQNRHWLTMVLLVSIVLNRVH